MFSKKEKILHEIAVNMRDGENKGPAAILAGANLAATLGGSMNAKDVAEILRYCAQAALGVDGIKAARELSREYENSVRKIREACRDEVARAETVAENEYERAREEFGRRAEEAEERLEQYREDAEELECMKEAVGEDIWEALARMVPERQRIYAETEKVVRAIEECGKFTGWQPALAV